MFRQYIRYLLIFLFIVLTTSCSRHAAREAQGYIEGRYTYMATSVSGVLKKILVERGTNIKQGQMLFALEEQPESDEYQAAVENLRQTIAARDVIVANLAYAKITYERYKILVPKNAIERSQLDNARSNYNATLAQLAQANANIEAATADLAKAKWTKEQKFVYAPIDGLVFDTYFRLGEYVPANQSVLSLLGPADIKVIFYVKEKYLSSIRLGDQVAVKCDDCKQSYTAKISFISPEAEYTPPLLFSNETNEKLVYRIEAKFALQEALEMHPGQPVRVVYYSHD